MVQPVASNHHSAALQSADVVGVSTSHGPTWDDDALRPSSPPIDPQPPHGRKRKRAPAQPQLAKVDTTATHHEGATKPVLVTPGDVRQATVDSGAPPRGAKSQRRSLVNARAAGEYSAPSVGRHSQPRGIDASTCGNTCTGKGTAVPAIGGPLPTTASNYTSTPCLLVVASRQAPYTLPQPTVTAGSRRKRATAAIEARDLPYQVRHVQARGGGRRIEGPIGLVEAAARDDLPSCVMPTASANPQPGQVSILRRKQHNPGLHRLHHPKSRPTLAAAVQLTCAVSQALPGRSSSRQPSTQTCEVRSNIGDGPKATRATSRAVLPTITFAHNLQPPSKTQAGVDQAIDQSREPTIRGGLRRLCGEESSARAWETGTLGTQATAPGVESQARGLEAATSEAEFATCSRGTATSGGYPATCGADPDASRGGDASTHGGDTSMRGGDASVRGGYTQMRGAVLAAVRTDPETLGEKNVPIGRKPTTRVDEHSGQVRQPTTSVVLSTVRGGEPTLRWVKTLTRGRRANPVHEQPHASWKRGSREKQSPEQPRPGRFSVQSQHARVEHQWVVTHARRPDPVHRCVSVALKVEQSYVFAPVLDDAGATEPRNTTLGQGTENGQTRFSPVDVSAHGIAFAGATSAAKNSFTSLHPRVRCVSPAPRLMSVPLTRAGTPSAWCSADSVPSFRLAPVDVHKRLTSRRSKLRHRVSHHMRATHAGLNPRGALSTYIPSHSTSTQSNVLAAGSLPASIEHPCPRGPPYLLVQPRAPPVTAPVLQSHPPAPLATLALQHGPGHVRIQLRVREPPAPTLQQALVLGSSKRQHLQSPFHAFSFERIEPQEVKRHKMMLYNFPKQYTQQATDQRHVSPAPSKQKGPEVPARTWQPPTTRRFPNPSSEAQASAPGSCQLTTPQNPDASTSFQFPFTCDATAGNKSTTRRKATRRELAGKLPLMPRDKIRVPRHVRGRDNRQDAAHLKSVLEAPGGAMTGCTAALDGGASACGIREAGDIGTLVSVGPSTRGPQVAPTRASYTSVAATNTQLQGPKNPAPQDGPIPPPLTQTLAQPPPHRLEQPPLQQRVGKPHRQRPPTLDLSLINQGGSEAGTAPQSMHGQRGAGSERTSYHHSPLPHLVDMAVSPANVAAPAGDPPLPNPTALISPRLPPLDREMPTPHVCPLPRNPGHSAQMVMPAFDPTEPLWPGPQIISPTVHVPFGMDVEQPTLLSFGRMAGVGRSPASLCDASMAAGAPRFVPRNSVAARGSWTTASGQVFGMSDEGFGDLHFQLDCGNPRGRPPRGGRRVRGPRGGRGRRARGRSLGRGLGRLPQSADFQSHFETDPIQISPHESYLQHDGLSPQAAVCARAPGAPHRGSLHSITLLEVTDLPGQWSVSVSPQTMRRVAVRIDGTTGPPEDTDPLHLPAYISSPRSSSGGLGTAPPSRLNSVTAGQCFGSLGPAVVDDATHPLHTATSELNLHLPEHPDIGAAQPYNPTSPPPLWPAPTPTGSPPFGGEPTTADIVRADYQTDENVLLIGLNALSSAGECLEGGFAISPLVERPTGQAHPLAMFQPLSSSLALAKRGSEQIGGKRDGIGFAAGGKNVVPKGGQGSGGRGSRSGGRRGRGRARGRQTHVVAAAGQRGIDGTHINSVPPTASQSTTPAPPYPPLNPITATSNHVHPPQYSSLPFPGQVPSTSNRPTGQRCVQSSELDPTQPQLGAQRFIDARTALLTSLAKHFDTSAIGPSHVQPIDQQEAGCQQPLRVAAGGQPNAGCSVQPKARGGCDVTPDSQPLVPRSEAGQEADMQLASSSSASSPQTQARRTVATLPLDPLILQALQDRHPMKHSSSLHSAHTIQPAQGERLPQIASFAQNVGDSFLLESSSSRAVHLQATAVPQSREHPGVGVYPSSLPPQHHQQPCQRDLDQPSTTFTLHAKGSRQKRSPASAQRPTSQTTNHQSQAFERLERILYPHVAPTPATAPNAPHHESDAPNPVLRTMALVDRMCYHLQDPTWGDSKPRGARRTASSTGRTASQLPHTYPYAHTSQEELTGHKLQPTGSANAACGALSSPTRGLAGDAKPLQQQQSVLELTQSADMEIPESLTSQPRYAAFIMTHVHTFVSRRLHARVKQRLAERGGTAVAVAGASNTVGNLHAVEHAGLTTECQQGPTREEKGKHVENVWQDPLGGGATPTDAPLLPQQPLGGESIPLGSSVTQTACGLGTAQQQDALPTRLLNSERVQSKDVLASEQHQTWLDQPLQWKKRHGLPGHVPSTVRQQQQQEAFVRAAVAPMSPTTWSGFEARLAASNPHLRAVAAAEYYRVQLTSSVTRVLQRIKDLPGVALLPWQPSLTALRQEYLSSIHTKLQGMLHHVRHVILEHVAHAGTHPRWGPEERAKQHRAWHEVGRHVGDAVVSGIQAMEVEYQGLPATAVCDSGCGGSTRSHKVGAGKARRQTLAKEREAAAAEISAVARASLQLLHVLEGVIQSVSYASTRQKLDELRSTRFPVLRAAAVADNTVHVGLQGRTVLAPTAPRGWLGITSSQLRTEINMKEYRMEWEEYTTRLVRILEESLLEAGDIGNLTSDVGDRTQPTALQKAGCEEALKSPYRCGGKPQEAAVPSPSEHNPASSQRGSPSCSSGSEKGDGDDIVSAVVVRTRFGTELQVTREQLSDLVDRTSVEAANQLSIPNSQFKKLLKALGIQRWPNRLIHSILKLRTELKEAMETAQHGDTTEQLVNVDLDTALAELDEVVRQARLFVVHKIDDEIKELRQALFKLKHTLTRRNKKARDSGK